MIPFKESSKEEGVNVTLAKRKKPTTIQLVEPPNTVAVRHGLRKEEVVKK